MKMEEDFFYYCSPKSGLVSEATVKERTADKITIQVLESTKTYSKEEWETEVWQLYGRRPSVCKLQTLKYLINKLENAEQLERKRILHVIDKIIDQSILTQG